MNYENLNRAGRRFHLDAELFFQRFQERFRSRIPASLRRLNLENDVVRSIEPSFIDDGTIERSPLPTP